VTYQVHPVEVDEHSQCNCYRTLNHDCVAPPLIALLPEESKEIREAECEDDVSHKDNACAKEENKKHHCIQRVPNRVVQIVRVHQPPD